MMSSTEHSEVFISYSSKDEDQRKHLEEHLAVLHYQDKLSFWSDEQLQLNNDWRSVINENLENCKIAVLLISRHFLASNFIMKEEMPIFLERRKRGELKIFMLMLSPCNWKEVTWTESIQGFPRRNSPLSGIRA